MSDRTFHPTSFLTVCSKASRLPTSISFLPYCFSFFGMSRFVLRTRNVPFAAFLSVIVSTGRRRSVIP